MIVVDPQLIFWAEGPHDCVRKPRVDGAIRLPFRGRVFRVRREGVKQRPQRPIREAGVVRAGKGLREHDGSAVEFFLKARGDLLGFAGRDGAWPPEPASLQFSMKRAEACRDSAGIRLHVEAIPDSPNGDRKTVRDEDESHVRKGPVIDPVAGGQVADGASGSGSGRRACREREDIMHNNAVSRRPSECAAARDEDDCGNHFHVF